MSDFISGDEAIDGDAGAVSLDEVLSCGARLGFRLRKHEREALKVIREVADRYGVAVEVVRRGRGPIKAVFEGVGGRKIVGVPTAPTDRDWSTVVARKQATAACRAVSSLAGGA